MYDLILHFPGIEGIKEGIFVEYLEEWLKTFHEELRKKSQARVIPAELFLDFLEEFL